MPFGSERSHFAHSPHLLAALILLIPPEIGGELKRKARSRGCGLGFCCARSPGAVPRGASSGSRLGAGVGGRRAARSRRMGLFLHLGGGGADSSRGGCRPSPPRPSVRSPQARPQPSPGAPGCWRRLLGVGEWGCLWGEAAGRDARWTCRWGGGWDLTALRGPEARVQEPHPTLGQGAVSRAD